MKKILFYIFPLVFFLHSCEEIVEGEALPHDEKLVVRGVLTPLFKNGYRGSIKITRTLPALEEYSLEKAEVKDAEVFIEVDSIKHQMYYSESSQIENSEYSLGNGYEVIQPGKTYKLMINWKGKTAFSQMSIPNPPEIAALKIDSVKRRTYNGIERWEKVVKAFVKPRQNESYTITYTVFNKRTNYKFMNEYFEEVRRFDEINNEGLVEISGEESYSGDLYSHEFEVIVYVHAFDSQFAEYFKTRYDNHSDVTFREPTKVKWNVFGNAIGMFTGYSTAVDTLEF